MFHRPGHFSQLCTHNFKHNFKTLFTRRSWRHGHTEISTNPPQKTCQTAISGSKQGCGSHTLSTEIMPVIPQSDILAKLCKRLAEKCGKLSAKCFADFRPSISREKGARHFTKKSSTFSTAHQAKFFHCCNSGRTFRLLDGSWLFYLQLGKPEP